MNNLPRFEYKHLGSDLEEDYWCIKDHLTNKLYSDYEMDEFIPLINELLREKNGSPKE